MLVFSKNHTKHDFGGLHPLRVYSVRLAQFTNYSRSFFTKKLGSKRLVLAHVDIGSAASHDYFWQAGWREGSPSWISGPTKDNPDRHFVQYWHPNWQNIIFGNTNSYIYGLTAQGFDGVILTGLESYKYFLGSKDDDE